MTTDHKFYPKAKEPSFKHYHNSWEGRATTLQVSETAQCFTCDAPAGSHAAMGRNVSLRSTERIRAR